MANIEFQRRIPPTIAQQTFTIISGVAGGMAGFLLANKLSNVEDVSTSQVLLAAGLSAAATAGSIYLIRTE